MKRWKCSSPLVVGDVLDRIRGDVFRRIAAVCTPASTTTAPPCGTKNHTNTATLVPFAGEESIHAVLQPAQQRADYVIFHQILVQAGHLRAVTVELNSTHSRALSPGNRLPAFVLPSGSSADGRLPDSRSNKSHTRAKSTNSSPWATILYEADAGDGLDALVSVFPRFGSGWARHSAWSRRTSPRRRRA